MQVGYLIQSFRVAGVATLHWTITSAFWLILRAEQDMRADGNMRTETLWNCPNNMIIYDKNVNTISMM